MAATPTRRRRARTTAADTVEQVSKLVDNLIKENRTLRRQVSKLETSGSTSSRGRAATSPAEKALSTIKRKLERAVTSRAATPRRRATATATKPRRPVSPEVAERRRQALAKARQVRAERRAASAGAAR